jgi:CheY-like chemotaxis protein
LSTILVIDDDAEIRGLIRLIVAAEGHEVIEADSAAAGIEALALAPDAIFVDVEMPGATGAQFLLALRQHPKVALTPATFVTAHQDRVALFAQHGMADKHIIPKPFHRKDICEALSRMLGSLSRRNLRVALHPGELSAAINGQAQVPVVRLSNREIYVRGGPLLDIGRRYALTLSAGDTAIACEARVEQRLRGETRFSVEPGKGAKQAISALIASLLADAHAHEDTRDAPRIELSASITWERDGQRDVGFLRDLSASGAYVVTTTCPALHDKVRVYLPFQAGSKNGIELRSAEAEVMRLGGDGFGCRFAGENVDFFVAVNGLMSDGTVVAGKGADVG